MRKRYILLIAALVVVIGLCIAVLSADSICIGRMESRTDDQWSLLHLYLNGEVTVDFPIETRNQRCLFQYETGRGSFSVEITDAHGNTVYADTTDETGSATFQASSDLTIRLRGRGHGGAFSLLKREKPSYYLGDNALSYGVREEGTHTGDQFTAAYDLRKADGKYVNFYVENYGTGSVVITINDDYARTIAPGTSGHICAPISVSFLPQRMSFKCESTDGSSMDIYWKIAQRTENST